MRGDRLVLKSKLGFSIKQDDIDWDLLSMSLHCVDIERCTAMTIMDGATPNRVEISSSGVETFGHGCTEVHGFLPGGIYREDDPMRSHYDSDIDDDDDDDDDDDEEEDNYGPLEKFWHWDEEKPDGVESCTCYGFLNLVPKERDSSEFGTGGKSKAVSFDFHPGFDCDSLDNTDRDSICALYRAVMQEKCP